MIEELSLHILDIAENSYRAGASKVDISVVQDGPAGTLRLIVEDDGRGIPPGILARIFDPFVTTRTERRVGLGLPFLRQAAEMTGGSASVESTPGKGTRVEAWFGLAHPDRQPLGDLGSSIAALLAQNAPVRLRLLVEADGKTFTFDSGDLEEQLGPGCFADARVLSWVAELVAEEQAALGCAP